MKQARKQRIRELSGLGFTAAIILITTKLMVEYQVEAVERCNPGCEIVSPRISPEPLVTAIIVVAFMVFFGLVVIPYMPGRGGQ